MPAYGGTGVIYERAVGRTAIFTQLGTTIGGGSSVADKARYMVQVCTELQA